MENFELIFKCWYEDGWIEARETSEFKRVVFLENQETAEKVAQAMLGEEVRAHEYLWELKSIRPTNKECDLISYDNDKTWQRTLKKLGLDPEVDVTFGFSESGQKIGFSPQL